ncbi:MAG: tRNA pseudouridine(38-40) synthase TruA, partial [Endomicrobiales bacterium]
QPGVSTVQGELEAAAEKVLGVRPKFTAAGRTDAGVHARGQAASFALDRQISVSRFPLALNAVLPDTIAVRSMKKARDGFNARFDAREKIYEYQIWNQRLRSVAAARNAWHVPRPLDIKAMRMACRHLAGKHDFSAFDASGGTQPNKTARLGKTGIKRSRGYVVLTFQADRFLYKMVRTMTGMLAEVGLGKRSPESVKNFLKSRTRTSAGRTAPANGLSLKKVIF